MSARRIVVGYAQIWAPIVALVTLFATGIAPGLIALTAIASAAALAVWSWLGTGLHAAARRRSDFDRVAFGTRRHPSRLTRAQRTELRGEIEAQWRACAPDVNPEDVARYGTTDPQLAVTAYAMLRLAGLARGRDGTAELAAAERIVEGGACEPSPEGGPYRGLVLGGDGESIVREVARLAAPSPSLVASLRHERHTRYVLALAAITLLGIGAAVALGRAGWPLEHSNRAGFHVLTLGATIAAWLGYVLWRRRNPPT